MRSAEWLLCALVLLVVLVHAHDCPQLVLNSINAAKEKICSDRDLTHIKSLKELCTATSKANHDWFAKEKMCQSIVSPFVQANNPSKIVKRAVKQFCTAVSETPAKQLAEDMNLCECHTSRSTDHVYELVKDNKVNQIKSILDTEPQMLHMRDSNCRSPIAWAFELDKMQIVKVLTEAGADENAKDINGRTAKSLNERVQRENLLKKGQKRRELPCQDSDTTAKLYNIIRDDDATALRRMIDGDATVVDVRSADCRGPLFWAFELGRNNLVQMLLSAGADDKVKDKEGVTPRELAKKPVAAASRKKKAPAQKCENTRTTDKLYKVISQRRVDDLESWLESDPSIALARSSDCRGPLWWAHESGVVEMVDMLVKSGADEEAEDKQGLKPRDVASNRDTTKERTARPPPPPRPKKKVPTFTDRIIRALGGDWDEMATLVGTSAAVFVVLGTIGWVISVRMTAAKQD